MRMPGHKRCRAACGALAMLLLAAPLAACKDENRFVPPPPPQVGVAPPLKEKIDRFVFGTGNASAVNQVDLVARVVGFLQDIKYQDGQFVKKGDDLFIIEPLPYLSQLQQAQATVDSDTAQLKNAESEYARQAALGAKDFASQARVEDALTRRDTARSSLAGAQASVAISAIQYSYTRVTAPFEGVVSAHLQSVGELVGGTTPTKLATIVQLDPIWVTFTLSEQDVLRVRALMLKQGIVSRADLLKAKVPVEVGLQNETGFPHRGILDYVAPGLDPSTGTITVRGVFANTDRVLLPGMFARARVPIESGVEALLVPDTAMGADQLGRTLLVVNADNVVELRHVVVGETVGSLREVVSGLEPDDRVVTEGLQRAVPGQKVVPQLRTASRAS